MRRLLLLCALLIGLGGRGPDTLRAQETPFPLPADLYILSSDGRVIEVDAANGGQRYVSPQEQPVTDFALAPGGDWYAYRSSANNAVIVTEVSGMSGYVLEFDVPLLPPDASGRTIGWAPDASALAYLVPGGVRVALLGRGASGEAIIRAVQGGPWDDLLWVYPTRLFLRAASGPHTWIDITPDGGLEIKQMHDVPTERPPVPSTLTPDGVRLDDGTLVPGTAGALAFDWAPVPTISSFNTPKEYNLYFLMDDEDGIAQVWRLPRDTEPALALTHEAAPVTNYALAPAESEIAYASGDRLIAARLDGTNRRELGALQNSSPAWLLNGIAWSPDGTRLAYNDERGLWIVPADGSAPPRLLLQNIQDQQDVGRTRFYYDPRWSPDGTRLLVGAGLYEGSLLAVVDAASGSASEFNLIIARQGRWTPDGQVLTWSEYYGYGRPGLFLLDPAQPAADPRTVLDTPVIDVAQGAGCGWYALVIGPPGSGPQALRVWGADSLTGPFTLRYDELNFTFAAVPQLAPPRDDLPSSDGTVFVVAGLRRTLRDVQGILRGELYVIDVKNQIETRIETPRPVWGLRWGSVPLGAASEGSACCGCAGPVP